ncbi:MAG: hypothetical protein QM708_13470 [Propioniciclava sp.]|uniref:hypothetical protein n=1 Tax=Propioniciclava sp. TaxID=2038686 RepID=UPI0039E5B9F9
MTVLGFAVACGLMSSIVLYAAGLPALRRVPASVFGTFTSVNLVVSTRRSRMTLDASMNETPGGAGGEGAADAHDR